MEMWEYRTVVVKFTGPGQWDAGRGVFNSIAEALNAEGAQGWELVTAVQAEWRPTDSTLMGDATKYSTFGYNAFFKRRLP